MNFKKRGIMLMTSMICAGILASCVSPGSGKSLSGDLSKYRFTEQSGNVICHSMEHKKATADKYDHYMSNLSDLPVSFTYDGVRYRGLPTGEGAPFKEISRETVIHGNEHNKVSTEIVLSFRDNIEITLTSALYPDYCAYEWTLYFENKGEDNTALLEDLRCVDVLLKGGEPVLKGIYGDGAQNGTCPYAPYKFKLADDPTIHMTPETGRSTYFCFPYFNMQYGEGGTFAAIGWPIMWGATFNYVDVAGDEGIHFEAGQEYFSTYIAPGEKLRSPLCVMLDYEGRDDDRAANLWRHWFIDCNMRKIDGQLFEANLSGYTGVMYGEMVNTNEAQQLSDIQMYLGNDVPLSYWWMDAGWYFEYGEKSLDVWLPTGTWTVDTKRFPTKFRAISDFCAEKGMKTLLWFEPEVVRLDPKLRDKENGIPQEYMMCDVLADMSNPDFIDWVLERFSTIITEGGISLYRQDYGIDPAYYFLKKNVEGRVGAYENLYAQGYYSYWDKLIERFPNMMIDSCAAGGGRNDIESMRRAVPLHKTDYDYGNHEDKQSMHQDLFAWFPYFGTMVNGAVADTYIMRSNYAPWINLGFTTSAGILDWRAVSDYSYEWKSLNKYFYSDYYQLTEWSRGTENWRGWEFFSPEENAGYFQLFRPQDAEAESITVKLKGLDPSLTYLVRDLDTGKIASYSGKELTDNGVEISLPARGAGVYTIMPGSSD